MLGEDGVRKNKQSPDQARCCCVSGIIGELGDENRQQRSPAQGRVINFVCSQRLPSVFDQRLWSHPSDATRPPPQVNIWPVDGVIFPFAKSLICPGAGGRSPSRWRPCPDCYSCGSGSTGSSSRGAGGIAITIIHLRYCFPPVEHNCFCRRN